MIGRFTLNLTTLWTILILAGCGPAVNRQEEASRGPLTYAKHVAPLLNRECVVCHEQGLAPFALTNYAQVFKHAKTISEVVDSGILPPWLPVKGYGHFECERRLSLAERDTIQAWVESY